MAGQSESVTARRSAAIASGFCFLFLAGGVAEAQRPPVVLVDGYHLLCEKDNLSSLHDFGELEQRLNNEGVRTAFFGSCSERLT